MSVYANAGLPNPLSPTGYDLLPADMARFMKEYADHGLLNIVGGCCGTTRAHRHHCGCRGRMPRAFRLPKRLRFACPDMKRITTRGKTPSLSGNAATWRALPARLIREGNYEEAVSIARQQVENGALVLISVLTTA